MTIGQRSPFRRNCPEDPHPPELGAILGRGSRPFAPRSSLLRPVREHLAWLRNRMASHRDGLKRALPAHVGCALSVIADNGASILIARLSFGMAEPCHKLRALVVRLSPAHAALKATTRLDLIPLARSRRPASRKASARVALSRGPLQPRFPLPLGLTSLRCRSPHSPRPFRAQSSGMVPAT